VQLKVQLWNVNQQATEAEESPLLRFVTRKHCRGIAIVECCYQVKTSEGKLRRQCGVICSPEISNKVTIICRYDL
jgi:hypothetical protein